MFTGGVLEDEGITLLRTPFFKIVLNYDNCDARDNEKLFYADIGCSLPSRGQSGAATSPGTE